MKLIPRLLSLTLLAATLAPAARAAAPLRSPWDASLVPSSHEPYNCPRPQPISPDISVTEINSSNNAVSESVKAAAYAESGGALNDLMRSTLAAADTYRHTGSLPAAQCVGVLLSSAAEDHAMAGFMGSLVAWQAQNRALRALAIGYLKVRDSGAIPPTQTAAILSWMNAILHQERSFYEHGFCGKKTCDLMGHRGLEVAMASAAIGIATNDHGEFKWAVDQYRTAVETIDSHGMLHYDKRGRLALKFHIESAAALVQIAEFSEINGQPLYAYDNGYVHLLVHAVSRGLVDPQPFVAANDRHKQDELPKSLEPWEISWASVYNSRFPDPVITALLQQVGASGSDMWGGEPWTPSATDDAD